MHGYCRVHHSTKLYFEQNRLSLEKKEIVIYMLEVLQVGYPLSKDFSLKYKTSLALYEVWSIFFLKNTFCFYAACIGSASDRLQGLHRGKAYTRKDAHPEIVRNF